MSRNRKFKFRRAAPRICQHQAVSPAILHHRKLEQNYNVHSAIAIKISTAFSRLIFFLVCHLLKVQMDVMVNLQVSLQVLVSLISNLLRI